ncbi:hypothetical protein VKT23_017056 [Stygiomarasmius scandens]|uniref:C2H2-type domain-containing protein n=1 Tax=Marasmiellus scandens TaxID=2682957 RepID=A0ABR1IT55_9AGAR
MAPGRRNRARPAPERTALCQNCGEMFTPNGIVNHRKSCKKDIDNMVATINYEAELLGIIFDFKSKLIDWTVLESDDAFIEPLQSDFPGVSLTVETSYTSNDIEVHDSGARLNQIKTVFHPSSQIPDQFDSFQEFGNKGKPSTPKIPLDQCPWQPFPTRFDYEVSEFALRAGLNRNLTDELINLIHKASSLDFKLNMNNATDMNKFWDMASFKSPEFQKTTISAKFQEEEREFDFQFRPLWDWVVNIATNEELAQDLVWDAQQHFKFNTSYNDWERFIEEPWSADLWWKVQVCNEWL